MPSPERYHNLPDWVHELTVYPVPPETDYTTRARIAGVAHRDDAQECFAYARALMTRLGAPDHCPRKGCARAKRCSTLHACCWWENIDTLQRLVFPLLRERAAGDG